MDTAQWAQLARQEGDPNPIFEGCALAPALAQFDPEGSVKIATLHADGELVGLAPLRRASRYYGRTLPHWTIWLHDNAFVGAPLIAEGHEHAFWQALLGWCDTRAGFAPWLHCPALPHDGAPYRALCPIADHTRPAARVWEGERAMLASDRPPGEYFEQAMSAKKR
ncbi:hypothetical protein MKP08_13705 [Erythrobacter sp. LQ02-29]|uniref:hypothetical protein n=1 Tax=Erythrobacter sp. LQ02-29 TaxID=2920384 RepID=UPI001F4ECBE3|nr:hypothetical protein [Erythrobacter sp. LQ02-29]MCP9223799.1 hypothetical protein [Erythrobacter sp. LQ02-29]